MRKYIFLLLMLASLCLLACPALADELLVGAQGGYASLTEAVAAARPGDVIRIAPGEYAEPEEAYPIEIDKPLSLIGEPGAVLKSPPFKALLRVNAPDVTVRGIGFRLLKWGIVGCGDGLTVEECAFTLADDTYRVSSCGIWLAGGYGATLRNNAFTGCGVCVAGPPLGEGSKGKVVLTGLFEVGDDPALFASHHMEGNTVNGKPLFYAAGRQGLAVPKDAGQVIVACSTDVDLSGLDVSDNSIGAILIYCDNVTLTDVKADRCGIFGVYLAFVNGGTIQGVSSQDTNHGIDIRGAKNLLVRDCVTDGCEQGIFFSWVQESLAADCVMKNGGRGMFLAAGSNNQVVHCAMRDNENGLCTEGERGLLLARNAVTGNTVAGVRLLRGDVTCVDSDISGNWTGMIISETAPFTLSGNTFLGNKSCALYLRETSKGKIVLNQFGGDTETYISAFSESDMAFTGLNTFER